jgi:branched-chain amino acid transport system ATP-binding protein
MVLRVHQLSASYGNKLVVDRVSLAVEPGQILALFGHNGAGKTSMLKSLAGLMRGSSGEIDFYNERLDRLPISERVRRGLRLLPEGRGIFVELSVKENIDVVAAANCRPDCLFTPERVREIFPLLTERRDTIAGTLSGGQQQMLALALALLGNPKCLMLDEPSLGLAPNLVERIFEAVHDVCKQSAISAILVEQNVGAALKIADRIMIMNSGTIVFEGLPAEATASAFWDHF